MHYHFLLFISLYTYINTQQSSLNFELHKGQSNCLYEYFPENTMVILDIVSTSIMYVELKDPTLSIIYATDDDGTKLCKHAFTSTSTGYFEICIENRKNETSTIYFDLKYGVSARDYSSVAKAKDLKPIEVELQRIIDKKRLMHHYLISSNHHERIFESMLDSISSKIVLYSMVLMGVMIFIGIIETVYLRKFMEKRKLI